MSSHNGKLLIIAAPTNYYTFGGYEAIKCCEDRVVAKLFCYVDRMFFSRAAKAGYKLSRHRKWLIKQRGQKHISGP